MRAYRKLLDVTVIFSKTSFMRFRICSLCIPTLLTMLMLAGCASKQARRLPEKSTQNQASIGSESPTEVKMTLLSNHIKTYTLPNGLEVYLIEKRDIPMVTVLMAVKNGSFAETHDNNGLAHLYEHMFFKANAKIPSQPEFLKALDEMGIELGPNMNAYTSTESVRYFFTLQTSYLEKGLSLMADAIRSPQFLQEELEKERKVVIGEFDRFEASPTDVFFQRNLMSRLFPDHFIRKNTIGSRPVILGAAQQQMFEIKERYYLPNNSALFIVGDFPEDKIQKWLDIYFADWKRGPEPFLFYPVPEHPPLKRTTQFFEFGPVKTVTQILALHGPSLTKDNEATVVFDLIARILELESSPFQKELVHSGLTSHASFFSWSQRYTGPLIFSLETTPENAQKAYDKLMELFKRMQRGDFFNSEELRIAQMAVEVTSAYDREHGQRYVLGLANVWCSTGSLNYYTTYVEEVKKITPEKMGQVIQNYWAKKPFVFGALFPEGTKPIQFGE